MSKYQKQGATNARIRTNFKVVLATFCGRVILECGFRNLEVWSTSHLSHASYFAEVFPCLGLYKVYVNFWDSTVCFHVVSNSRMLHIKF